MGLLAPRCVRVVPPLCPAVLKRGPKPCHTPEKVVMFPYYCKECGQLDVEGISGHATNRCKGATNNVRGSATNNSQEGIGKQTQGSVKAVAKVEPGGKKGLQRVVRNDASKPVDVPSPEAGQAISGNVEDGGVERGLDRSGGGKTLNRRSRESYNAYQREYMRKRRSDAKTNPG